MSRFFAILSFVFLCSLTACGGGVGMGTALTSAAIYLTKPDAPPPAETSSLLIAHENWCYRTLGSYECYTKPQANVADQLINVDPENKRPLTLAAYNQAVFIAE